MNPTFSLAIVSTPIGNLGDLSPRAQETLQSADYILAEDTRRARKLKSRFALKAPLVSLHEHNEKTRIPKILAYMREGRTFALISDAGTPLLSDPGFLLVRTMIQEGLPFTHIPGPNAPVSALLLSGLPPYPFLFYGFLPASETQRKQILKELAQRRETLIFFESPDRVLGLLRQIGDELGDRNAAVCREMTKLHEEVFRGTITSLLSTLSTRKLLGEYTVVVGADAVGGATVTMDDEIIRNRYAQLQKEGYSRKEALKKLAKESGRSRNDLYRLLNELK